MCLRRGNDETTAFVKLFRIIYDLHIFETADGRIASNSEDFVCDLGLYFNTEIRNMRNLLFVGQTDG
jgi:hypothetical protein